jgi:hypothetical protein
VHRSSWNDAWKEEVDDNLPDGTRIRVVNEYRPWTAHDSGHDEAGCPRCGAILYDRLTHVFDVRTKNGREILLLRDYHLNSGMDLKELRALRVLNRRRGRFPSQWKGCRLGGRCPPCKGVDEGNS